MNSICPGRRSTFEKKIGLLFAPMKNSISVVVGFVHSVLSLFALILCQVPRLLFGTSIFCSVESVFTTPCSLGAIKSEISLVCCPPQGTVDVIVFAGIGERSISSYTCTSGSLAGSNASVNSPRWYHRWFSLSFLGEKFLVLGWKIQVRVPDAMFSGWCRLIGTGNPGRRHLGEEYKQQACEERQSFPFHALFSSIRTFYISNTPM